MYAMYEVAPYTGAWIEILNRLYNVDCMEVAPYTGAWIEMARDSLLDGTYVSHPTRVRGLKYYLHYIVPYIV